MLCLSRKNTVERTAPIQVPPVPTTDCEKFASRSSAVGLRSTTAGAGVQARSHTMSANSVGCSASSRQGNSRTRNVFGRTVRAHRWEPFGHRTILCRIPRFHTSLRNRLWNMSAKIAAFYVESTKSSFCTLPAFAPDQLLPLSAGGLREKLHACLKYGGAFHDTCRLQYTSNIDLLREKGVCGEDGCQDRYQDDETQDPGDMGHGGHDDTMTCGARAAWIAMPQTRHG